MENGGPAHCVGSSGLRLFLTAQYFAAKSAVSAGMAMRSDLFAHINTLSYREIDAIGTSTLINRMTNDVNQVQNGVNMFLRLFLRSPFVVLGAMIMAFTVDVQAAIPFVVTIPALLVVVFAILLVSMPLYRKVQKQLDKVLLSTRKTSWASGWCGPLPGRGRKKPGSGRKPAGCIRSRFLWGRFPLS